MVSAWAAAIPSAVLLRACLWPLLLSCSWPARGGTLPSALYEEWRKSPAPADGSVALVNPPSLQWASVRHWERRDVFYQVEMSNDANFPSDGTRRGPAQRWCFYNPHAQLKPGAWSWRYEIQDGSKRTIKGPYSFVIPATTPVFETPAFESFLASIPKIHPRVITQGRDLAAIRKLAATHPLSGDVIQRGKKAAAAGIYDGPLSDTDPARARTLERRASHEVRLFHALVDAYVLSGDPEMLEALHRRIDVLLRWPTDNLFGSQVLTALAKAYDALYHELSPEDRARILAVVEKQLRKGLWAWPGNIEGRQVENHFWQVELASNFAAALATVHDLAASREMLEYTYELFLGLLSSNKIPLMPENGLADGKLKLFERHVVFLRPKTIVIYDILDSEVPSDWTLLLHTMKKPGLNPDGTLLLETALTRALAYVAGSQSLAFDLTDQFYSPAVDLLKKYQATPNQYHIRYSSKAKSRSMRFLSILQIADPGEALPPVVDLENSKFRVNDIRLQAELDPEKTPSLSAERESAKLYVNRLPDEVFGQRVAVPDGPATLLAEKHEGKSFMIVSENLAPVR
ncbi:MAG: DUF4962 domain-containing protein [Planctomycetes bacterium]|nr:DUF4962 domain-containing protein [Planctomycetota bacterium]